MLRESIKDLIKKVIQFCILAALFIVPLAVFPSSIFPYITLKTILFYALSELAFFLYVILALFDKKYIPKKNIILISFGFLIFARFISTWFGVDPSFSFWSNSIRMDGLLTDLHLFVFFLTIASVATTNTFRKAMFAISLVSSAIVATTVYLGINGLNIMNKILSGPFRNFGYSGGLVGNDSYAGIYVLLNLFIAIYLLVSSRKRWEKIILSFSIIFLFFSPLFFNFKFFLGQISLSEIFSNPLILIGTSRAALVGVLFGAFSSILLFFFNSSKPLVKKFAQSSFFVSVAFLILVSVLIFIPDTQLNSKFNNITGGYRAIYVRQSISGWLDRPLFGYGPGNFGYVNTKYFNPHAYDDYPKKVELNADKVHNIVLENLVEGGAVGFLSWIFFMVSIFVLISRANILWREKVIFCGMMIAYLVESLTFFNVLVSSMILVLVIGALSSLENKHEDVDLNNTEVNKRKIIYVCLCLLPIGLYFSMHYFVAMPMRFINDSYYYYNLSPEKRQDIPIEYVKTSAFGQGDEENYIFAYVLNKYDNALPVIQKFPDPNIFLYDLDNMAEILLVSNHQNHLVAKYNLLFRIYQLKYKITQEQDSFASMLKYAKLEISSAPSHPVGYMQLVQALGCNSQYHEEVYSLYNKILELNLSLNSWVEEQKTYCKR